MLLNIASHQLAALHRYFSATGQQFNNHTNYVYLADMLNKFGNVATKFNSSDLEKNNADTILFGSTNEKYSEFIQDAVVKNPAILKSLH